MIKEKEYGHREFILTMLFDEPRGGPVNIVAKNEDEAKELLAQQYGHLKNYRVINSVPMDDVKPTPLDEMAAAMGSTVDKKVLN